MNAKHTLLENEFEHPVSEGTIEQFNTLQAFSSQSTGLLETTLADTLGLSMHNAVSNQQQSQMTTSASITNACARLLQTQTKPTSVQAIDTSDTAVVLTPDDSALYTAENEPKRKFSLTGFLKRDRKQNNE
ncbi:RebB family R body protein [Vibrio ostreicida]|uniref:RebB family R body protein n=1 Tax=Vibrio ostreicida TaxID=526588 RepID=UPI000970CCD8|nr:RebB family R body protein [Vibrio ostreicida]